MSVEIIIRTTRKNSKGTTFLALFSFVTFRTITTSILFTRPPIVTFRGTFCCKDKRI